MKHVVIQAFDNYVSAHIAMGRLAEDGISGWLKDENTVTIDPILSNALGGIKLMVCEDQSETAIRILRELEQTHKATNPCPKCGSLNVDQVSTPRKSSNWASMLVGLFLTSFAVPVEKLNHCFDCGHEYPLANPADPNADQVQ